MAFQVPKSKASIKQNRFSFEIEGKKYELPLMKYVSVETLAAFENERPIQGLIAAAPDDRTKDAIRALESDQLDALLTEWQEESEITPGESEAS